MMRVDNCEKLPGLLLGALNGGNGRVLQRRIVRLFEAQTQWTKSRRIVVAVACTAVMGIVCSISVAIGIQPVAAMSAQRAVQDVDTLAKIPTFDVVSIREDKSGHPLPEVWDLRPDGYHWSGVPLIALIMTAYPPSQSYTEKFTPDEVINIPDWMFHQFYNVDVKVADTDIAAWKQPTIQKAMLQAMLADRLKLTAHYDHKPGQAYELHVAKGGVKFKEAQTLDMAAIQRRDPNASAQSNGTVMARGAGPGEVALYNIPMAELCRDLRHMAGRPIVDKTGLIGRYDIVLQVQSPGADSSMHDSVDTVLYAVEQLGLKLDSVKAPVEDLVIDHVERPSEN